MPAQTTKSLGAPDRQTELEQQIEQTRRQMEPIQQKLSKLERHLLDELNKKKKKYEDHMSGKEVASGEVDLGGVLHDLCKFQANKDQCKMGRLPTYGLIANMLDSLKTVQLSSFNFDNVTPEEIQALSDLQEYVKADKFILATFNRCSLSSVYQRIKDLFNKVLDEPEILVTCDWCTANLVDEWWHCDGGCEDYDLCCLCVEKKLHCNDHSHEISKWKETDLRNGITAPQQTGEKLRGGATGSWNVCPDWLSVNSNCSIWSGNGNASGACNGWNITSVAAGSDKLLWG